MTRIAVVTGGARGIGAAVTSQLVDAGLRVVVLARDATRSEEPVTRAGAELVVGDLSDVASTRAAAQALTDACPRIDVLVHNAGIWPTGLHLNADGVEQSFHTNHLAPFLLDHLLAGRLGPGSRVVHVGAGLHPLGRGEPERAVTGADFHPIRTYADSKQAAVAVLPLLAARLAPATVTAVHPGVIRTALGARSGAAGLALRAVKRLWRSPEAGARPIVRLAVHPAVRSATGVWFEIEQEAPVKGVAADPGFAARVWHQAATLTGVPTALPGA